MDTEQKNILDGVIDLHVHTAPDVIRRTCNDLELTDAAVRAGARAIVIKGHHCGTVARVAVQRIQPDGSRRQFVLYVRRAGFEPGGRRAQ